MRKEYKECDLQSTKFAFVSVHCTRCADFPTPQLCFRGVMACACDRTPNIISIDLTKYCWLVSRFNFNMFKS